MILNEFQTKKHLLLDFNGEQFYIQKTFDKNSEEPFCFCLCCWNSKTLRWMQNILKNLRKNFFLYTETKVMKKL